MIISAVAALGVAACGSSGSSGTSGAASPGSTTGTTGAAAGGALSLSAFESQANRICTIGNNNLNAIPKPTSAAGVKHYIDRETPLFEQTAKQLQALMPPASERTAYQHYLSLLSQQLAVIRQAKSDADSGNVQGAVGLANSNGKMLEDQAHAVARQMHLTGCTK